MSDERSRREALDWLLRLEAPEANDDARAAFRLWLAADPTHPAAWKQVTLIVDATGAALRLPPPARRPRRAWVAAPLALAAGIAAFMLMGGPLRLQADRIAGLHEQPLVTLADGSTVQLDVASAIAVDFTAGQRVVRLLKGQAFFTVTPDPARPFTVEAEGGSARALGTAFEVRLTEEGAAVAVAQHLVEVSLADGARARLSPGQQLAYDAARLGAVQPVSLHSLASWRQGRLVAADMPLGELVAQLERRMQGRVLILDRALAARRVSGSFEVTDPAAALDTLAQALRLRLTRLGPLLTILRD